MTDYFTPTGNPVAQTRGVSSQMRTLFTAIQTGFGKVAGYTGNGNKLVRINSGATAQEAIALGTANQVLGMNNGGTAYEHKTVAGTTNQVTVTHGVGTVTISAPQNLHTAASPTFAGITVNTAVIPTVTGSHNLTGAVVNVVTQASSDSSTLAASTAFTQAVAFNTALPAQAGNNGKFVTTNGTNASWTGSMGVALNTSRATVASHATTADIWAAAGNQIDWTGTATTTIFPNAPQAGAERVLICAGACSFTAGTNMLIDGVASAATVTCAAGDSVIVRAVSTTQFKLSRVRYDGAAGLGANIFTGQQTFAETMDTVYTITDGAAFEIDPVNGNVQIVTLGANRTPAATNFAAGQTVILGIDDGTAYSVTWTTVAPVWVKAGGTGAAPTLAATGYTWVLLWRVGSVTYAAEVGKP